PKVTLINGNFRNMDTLLSNLDIQKVDRVLLDIGLSNRQLADSKRGFSFMQDEPLLMTFNPNPKDEELTAEEIVNSWDEENIADIIYGYGGERFSRRIAKNIVLARSEKRITTTSELAMIIEKSIPRIAKKGKTNPATKTFQALRIAVNDELRALKDGISKGIDLLEKDGRLAIISFHSGEDRIVKQMFRDYQSEGVVEILTKRPIAPSSSELEVNPKARSAKLRIIKKIT
ncbi:MAG: 16S rRNA (cytosine(1402)-N(4))-methyltransferase RsmH, partial [Candidatus Pacebacteria bacterium]|nr:16S rRNA (cytosine(1402)-N(4))-methyltransferase RsmH [Candidatus Paceibacterota bacterium]